MGQRRNKAYKRDMGEGAEYFPTTLAHPVANNIVNIGIGQANLGSRKWISRQLSNARKQNFPELAEHIGTTENPLIPKFIHDRWFGSTGSTKITRNRLRQSLSGRAYKACTLLRDCQVVNTSFVTVVTSVAFSREEAWQAVIRDGKKLQSLIYRRFSNAIFIMVPEVDILLAKDVSAGLLADSTWKRGVSDNRVVYKIHFHGVMYVPSMTRGEVQKSFQVTKTGMRSKDFSGANQVRAIQIKHEDEGVENKTDVFKVIGYAEKRHFKPPVRERMTECFAEWLMLTNQITSTPSVTITGGTTRGICKLCPDCNEYYKPDDLCKCHITPSVNDDSDVIDDCGNILCDFVISNKCDPLSSFNLAYIDSLPFTFNDSIDVGSIYPINSFIYDFNDSHINLDCTPPNNWSHSIKIPHKKENRLVATAARFVRKLYQMINLIRGP